MKTRLEFLEYKHRHLARVASFAARLWTEGSGDVVLTYRFTPLPLFSGINKLINTI